jgi:hypothetical protein
MPEFLCPPSLSALVAKGWMPPAKHDMTMALLAVLAVVYLRLV